MANHKVSLGFAQLSDAQLDAFTENVIAKMTGNATYPDPPLPIVDLTEQLTAFTNALAAAASGGKEATAIKDNLRAQLVASLRQIAVYVQLQCNGDLPLLLSSGYNATSTNRAQSPLTQPIMERVDFGNSTELIVRVLPVRNAKSYEVRISANGGTSWQPAGIFTQSRRMLLQSLTPGTTYTIQARAVGGSTGYSDWSDPISHMAA